MNIPRFEGNVDRWRRVSDVGRRNFKRSSILKDGEGQIEGLEKALEGEIRDPYFHRRRPIKANTDHLDTLEADEALSDFEKQKLGSWWPEMGWDGMGWGEGKCRVLRREAMVNYWEPAEWLNITQRSCWF
jgi:hypothetical protein